MNQDEQQVIRSLFQRLNEAERRSPPRDEDAEALIQREVAAQPAAPYYMAQTVLVQEEALKAAQSRIETLEREARERPANGTGGGFLGSLFGGGQQARSEPARAPQPQTPQASSGPWGGRGGPAMGAGGYGAGMQPGGAMAGRGGGFLAGAAQTAVGVAGGVMLGSMLGSMFSGANPFGGEAEQTADAGATPTDTGSDTADAGGYENASYDDGGADLGYDDGGGDFDEI